MGFTSSITQAARIRSQGRARVTSRYTGGEVRKAGQEAALC
jgi:hypothetical protein